MPSRKDVFGRQQPGIVPIGGVAGTKRENVFPSSVERATYTVVGVRFRFSGKATKAMYRFPAASIDG